MASRRVYEDDRGAGTVTALGVVGVLLVLALGVIGLAQAQAASGRARTAADLSALAGATVVSSVTAPGDPCDAAQRVAGANGARLGECTVKGEDVTVSVTVPVEVLGVPRHAQAQARAGPLNALPGL
ncbi:Rv3654c family TadE-like protein [Actinomyces sp. 2119]|uniref:Rv3654c family TadE-like protein n=1 Tax=Actinomyces sp. 2119 TaxID=2321393 RepID=UPI001600FFFF|nr:Rv3654c family TadE-like protein [Actinomyces sp. 2119]